MKLSLDSAISNFGAAAEQKLANKAAKGEPEDQLRAPFEALLLDLAELASLTRKSVTAVGESSVSDLRTRPDYAVTVQGALVGFVELKAPGKGADPRKFRDRHDRAQWEKLQALPNVLYTDGNSFSLWQSGELVGPIVILDGEIESSGARLKAPSTLVSLFDRFFRWQPITPRSAKELAKLTARLCRFLRDEVTEQLKQGSQALTDLATDWRKLLFPDATDERFADGYAQAVTFGLLMARAKQIPLSLGLDRVAAELSTSNSLIGAALRLLTDNAENQTTLKTSLGTLTRVLDAVDWSSISKDSADAWLYFYEDFLEIYDNQLRKQTGSYYTPPEVVSAMVGLVDEALRSPTFGLHAGFASPSVTIADPAVGTGTFLLGILRRIAETVDADEGSGSVADAIQASIKRLIAFEMQLGPFAVAQLRILAEVVELTGAVPKTPLRMFVTNTLGDPDDAESWIPGLLAPIARSRKEANRIKREEPITVVIGNPPYKEKAKGQGGWIEGKNEKGTTPSPLQTWLPPPEWGVGAHSKHLRNLYVYFWRWATHKVFDYGPGPRAGVVCFITVAGFLRGPGFQRMREYLRQTCDEVWVIDCSPEGHQPEVSTRIFQGVQQPVCIVLATRSAKRAKASVAKVRFYALPSGKREAKFTALNALSITMVGWQECPADSRSPFLPESTGAWASYPLLERLFDYSGSGVMPGRTWVIAPDAESLERRWSQLVEEPAEGKEALFHPHMRNGELGDRHSMKPTRSRLGTHEIREAPVAYDTRPVVPPTRYAFRSFDRQWIIPDSRLINQPNPEIWSAHSDQQVYLTALTRTSPSSGPALTVTGLIPDLDHYNARGGRAFPLWRDATARESYISKGVRQCLTERFGLSVLADDMFAYIVAIVAHPGYILQFRGALATPGLRVPLTAHHSLFVEAVEIGRRVVWLHTFGERMSDPTAGRPARPPRLEKARAPRIPADGAIAADGDMPDHIAYDLDSRTICIGAGRIENVPLSVWEYEVSGKQIVPQWFSYRRKDRSRPVIGDRRQPSSLANIQPATWLPEYTTELINVLNVLGLLVDLEPQQDSLLKKVCAGPLVNEDELRKAGALERPVVAKRKTSGKGPTMFDIGEQ